MTRNTMTHAADNFHFRRHALFSYPDAFDFTRETAVKGFLVSGTQPLDTYRKIIFTIGDQLFYFTNDGLTRFPHHPVFTDILAFGNSIDDIIDLDGIPEFIGKRVGFMLALDAPADLRVMPRLQLGARVSSFNDLYEKDQLSPVIVLNPTRLAKILNLDFTKKLNGFANLKLSVRLRDDFNNWSDWLNFSDAINQFATAIQFKATHTLTTLDGSDDSNLLSVSCNFSSDASKLSGDSIELFTNTISFLPSLSSCYALINHSPLVDASIDAFVSFKKPFQRRLNLLIGHGTGNVKTYFLGEGGAVDKNIDHNSLTISVDGKNFHDFYFNTSTASVDLAAVEGATIHASYKFDVDPEVWLPMQKISSTCNGHVCSTRFAFRLDNSDNVFAAVRFSISRHRGSVDEFILTTSNGKTQRFNLPHHAISESINVKNADFVFDENSNLLDVTGIANSDIFLSYDWRGSFPDVYKIIAGFSY